MTTENSVKTVPFPARLNLSLPANFKRLLIKFKPLNQVAYASWQLLSADEESLAVLQIGNTTGVLFLLIYWHLPSPHLILPLKTRIILKSLNEACKRTTFRNVKRDSGCRENTAKEMAAMIVYQTNPPGIELYFFANIFFCFSNPICLMVT